MMTFASTWNNLLEYCIFTDFLLREGYKKGALRKELRIDTFAERLKTATQESLADKNYHYQEQFT